MLLFHWKIADRLRFMKTEEIQAARTTLWTILKIWARPSHELTENVSCIDSGRKESSEPQVYPCFLTNQRGDIINGWRLASQLVSRFN